VSIKRKVRAVPNNAHWTFSDILLQMKMMTLDDTFVLVPIPGPFLCTQATCSQDGGADVLEQWRSNSVVGLSFHKIKETSRIKRPNKSSSVPLEVTGNEQQKHKGKFSSQTDTIS
jgi:hypothetical protein